MATQKIMIPFWKEGAFHWAELTGTYSTTVKVDEGMPCVRSDAISTTPPQRLQPDPSP